MDPVGPQFWIHAASKTFFVSEDELLGAFGSKDVREFRLATMWVARKMTKLSYPVLARAFGKDDHTTIINGVNRAETDERIAGFVEEILEYVEAGMPE